MTRQWKRISWALLIAAAAVVILALTLQGTAFLSRAAPDRGSPGDQKSHADGDGVRPEGPGTHSPEPSQVPAATATVIVTDFDGAPLPGAEIAAGSARIRGASSGYRTDDAGRVTIPLPVERTPSGWWMSARRVGYFESMTVLPFEPTQTQYALTFCLKREPQLRVFDAWGRPILNYSITSADGTPVSETRGIQSLVHAFIGAEGYLSIPVRGLPLLNRPEIMNAYADGPSETHADVYLVGTAGVPELRVAIQGAPSDAEVFATIEVVNEKPSVPPRSPVADSPELARLGGEWRDFYVQGPLSEPPSQIVFVDTTRSSKSQRFRVGDGLRVYARGNVAVKCYVKDHTRAEGSARIGSGEHRTLIVHCARSDWPRYQFDLIDRYGRVPHGPVSVCVGQSFLATMSLGRNQIAVPSEREPGGWTVSFTSPGLGSTTLVLRPEDDLARLGRVEFDAVELVLRFVDEGSGAELAAGDIATRVGVSEGRYVGGAFHFGLVSPKGAVVEIQSRVPKGGAPHGPVRRVPLVIAADSREPMVEQVVRMPRE